MKIEQLSESLKNYLSQFSFMRVLLPLSSVLLYVFAGLRLLDTFISLGSLVGTLVYILYFVALVLTLANCHFRDIAIGTGVVGIMYLISFLRGVISLHYLPYGSLIYLLLYALVAFLAYKKSLSFN